MANGRDLNTFVQITSELYSNNENNMYIRYQIVENTHGVMKW